MTSEDLVTRHLESLLDEITHSGPPDVSHLLSQPFNHPVPLWFDVCRRLFIGPDPGNRRSASLALRRYFVSEELLFSQDMAWATATPQHIARLAAALGERASFAGEAGRLIWTPSLQDALILQALRQEAAPPHAADAELDMVQLLRGKSDVKRGELARLVLRRVDVDAGGAQGRIVRAAGAVLMLVDDDFNEGLQQVQKLLDHVLKPGAPSVSWCLRGLPERNPQTGEEHDAAPAFRRLTGNSATAAIAYGALYLLRRHLREAFSEERLALEISSPERVTVSAALRWPDEMAQLPSAWPLLAPVGDLDLKHEVLARLPRARRVACLYTAHGQYSMQPRPSARPVRSLRDLIHRVADDENSALSAPERQLYAWLVGDEEAKPPDTRAHRDMLDHVAAAPPARSVIGFLLRSYARHAAGRSSPFRQPQQLDRHFVHLELRFNRWKPAEAGQPDRIEHVRALDLGQLLTSTAFTDTTAWVLVGGPMAGKTTLLAQWMMRTAREALRRHRSGQGWGEVCVFLPMRNFVAELEQHNEKSDPIGAALTQLALRHAAGLPPLSALLGGASPEPTMQVRLLIDGLNEVAAESWGDRELIVRRICRWIADHPAGRLAPVFSVREHEFGMNLHITDGAAHLQPVEARLQPWTPEEIGAYVKGRGLTVAASGRLLSAIEQSHSQGGDAGSFASFCSVPGVLAAQCALLAEAPDSPLPQRRGQLLMALLFSALAALAERLPGEPLDDTLLPKAVRDRWTALSAMLDGGDWSRPEMAGTLLEGLAAQGHAMQERGVVDDEPSSVPPTLQAPDSKAARERWQRYARVLGLGQDFGGRWSFTHQQWLELFAALGLTPDARMELAPPPLDPPTEALLLMHLASGGELQLPPVPQRERLLFVTDLCPAADVERWVRRLMDENLALAAHVAIAHRARLEDDPWTRPAPLLQHLRRLLLLRSVDAGATVRARVLASGIQSALEVGAEAADPELAQAWRQARDRAFRGSGVDIRHRIEAGLLLGHLGDTLRYEKVPASGGKPGLRLRDAHWIGTGKDVKAAVAQGVRARSQTFRIGGDPRGQRDERPGFPLTIDGFAMAAYAVTVAEWRCFVEAGGYDSEMLDWWQDQGPAALAWLLKSNNKWEGRHHRPSGLDNNPSEPMARITWFEATAYALWAAPMYDRPGSDWRLRVPTEVEWEAGVRGPRRWRWRFPSWPHPEGSSEPDRLCFNHHDTGLFEPTPVGVCSRGYTATGVADAAGNVREWCANEYRAGYQPDQGKFAGGPSSVASVDPDPRALRGGDYNFTAVNARVGFRDFNDPGFVSNDVGLRLVRVWLPHL